MPQDGAVELNRPVIMIVDDETDLVDVLGDALSFSLKDHDILKATSFEDAQRLLGQLKQKQRNLSLMIVDQELGDCSGLDVIDHSRRSFPTCAFLLYTGRAQMDTIERAKSTGTKVLWKPQRLNVIVDQIRELI